MGSCLKISVFVLVALNLIIMALGLALIVTGVLVRTNLDIVKEEFIPVLEQVTFGSFNLATLSLNLSIVFIVVGAFLFIVSGLGCFGAWRKSKFLLVVYSVIVGIFLVTELVAVALWIHMQNEVEDVIKTAALKNFDTTFKTNDLNTDNAISNGWNLFFMKFKCCGVNNVTKISTGFEQTAWCQGKTGDCATGTNKIPQSCCKGITTSNYINATSKCYAELSAGTYYDTGCYDTMKNDILVYGKTFIGIGITVLIIELFVIIASFFICRSIEDK